MAQITGTNGNDSLTGTSGDDTISPMLGRDIVDGSSGYDTVVIDYAALGTALRFMELKADGTGGFTGDADNGFNMSYLQLSSIESVVINGAAGAEVEVQESPALANVNISLTNAPGSEIFLAETTNATVTVGTDGVVRTGAGTYSGFTNVHVIATVAGTNHIVTGAGADIVQVGAGASTISTGDGDDTIYSAGADTIDGGAGTDAWTGDYSATTAPLTFTYDGANGTMSNGLRLSNIETVQLTGGSGADTFTVAKGAYYGGAGIDTLNVDRSASTAVFITQATFNVDSAGVAGFIRTDVFGGGVSFQQFENINFKDDNHDNGVVLNIGALPSGLNFTIDAGGGSDALVLNYSAPQALVFTTSTSGVATSAFGTFSNFEVFTVTVGSSAPALVTTGAGADRIVGGAGADTLSGGGGADTLTGGGGDDSLSGGSGTDTAIYGGPRAAYMLTYGADGGYTVKDLRSGSPDGTDHLTSVEVIQFADTSVTMGVDLSAAATAAVANVLRVQATAPSSLAFDQLIAPMPAAQQVATIIGAAGSTTSVATLAYEFFTGHTPTTAGIDYLVSPTGTNPNNLNSAYYQSFNLENRYINFAVNLGKLGEGAAAFAQAYGALSFYDAFKKAYGVIFGATPSDAHIHAILDPTLTLNGQSITRQQYFADYGGDGLNGIGTKAAAVGWLMSEAEKADLGTYAKSNDAFLTDIANGAANFGVDLIGAYAKPEYAYHA